MSRSLKSSFFQILICNLQTKWIMAIVFIKHLHMIPIFDQNIMIMCSVVSVILGFSPQDAINLSKKAEAITCFAYELFISGIIIYQITVQKSQCLW